MDERLIRLDAEFLVRQVESQRIAYLTVFTALHKAVAHGLVGPEVGQQNFETLILAAAGFLISASVPPDPRIEFRFPAVAAETAVSNEPKPPSSDTPSS